MLFLEKILQGDPQCLDFNIFRQYPVSLFFEKHKKCVKLFLESKNIWFGFINFHLIHRIINWKKILFCMLLFITRSALRYE